MNKKIWIIIGKSIFSLLLLSIGILLIRWICSSPRVFSIDLVIWIVVGFIFILLAVFEASKLLYSRLKIAKRNIFIVLFIIVLLFLSFGSNHNALYPFIRRIGQNGIVPDTEIVIEAEIPGLTPNEAIYIADEYLRIPITNGVTTREKYVKMMYRDHWMKKVVVSTCSGAFLKYEEDTIMIPSPLKPKIYKLPTYETFNEIEELYEVFFYFGEDDILAVCIDPNGNVAGVGSSILLE